MAKTVTISLDEKTDEAMRRYAEAKYGKGKGHLKLAYKEAIEALLHSEEQERIRERALEHLEKGIAFKRRWKFNREEAHER